MQKRSMLPHSDYLTAAPEIARPDRHTSTPNGSKTHRPSGKSAPPRLCRPSRRPPNGLSRESPLPPMFRASGFSSMVFAGRSKDLFLTIPAKPPRLGGAKKRPRTQAAHGPLYPLVIGNRMQRHRVSILRRARLTERGRLLFTCSLNWAVGKYRGKNNW